MNKHAEAFRDYLVQRGPVDVEPVIKKQAAPPEPSCDLEAMANDLYFIFCAIKDRKHDDPIPEFVLEDLMDAIEELSPGYLAEAGP